MGHKDDFRPLEGQHGGYFRKMGFVAKLHAQNGLVAFVDLKFLTGLVFRCLRRGEVGFSMDAYDAPRSRQNLADKRSSISGYLYDSGDDHQSVLTGDPSDLLEKIIILAAGIDAIRGLKQVA